MPNPLECYLVFSPEWGLVYQLAFQEAPGHMAGALKGDEWRGKEPALPKKAALVEGGVGGGTRAPLQRKLRMLRERGDPPKMGRRSSERQKHRLRRQNHIRKCPWDLLYNLPRTTGGTIK